MFVKLARAAVLAAAVLTATHVDARAQIGGGAPGAFFVVNGIPGRNIGPFVDPLLPVNFYITGNVINGNIQVFGQGVNFGSVAGPFEVNGGTYPVYCDYYSGSTNFGVSASLTLLPGRFAALVAALSTAGQPVAEIYPLEMGPVAVGWQRIIVVHAANAPAIVVTAAGPDGHATRTFNLSSGESENSLDIATSNMTFTATAGGTVLASASAPTASQSVVIAFVVGSAATHSVAIITKVIPFVF